MYTQLLLKHKYPKVSSESGRFYKERFIFNWGATVAKPGLYYTASNDSNTPEGALTNGNHFCWNKILF